MGACHVDLGAAYLGAYPGVGAYHSTGQNSYLGAYPGVGACPGDYGIAQPGVMVCVAGASEMYNM